MFKVLRLALLLTAACVPATVFAQDVTTMTPEEALPFLDAMSVDELLPLALKEGSVTIFSLSSRIARVEKAFEEAYPGIDLIGLDLSS
ncbi:MAG TPA: hypothetical protein VL133_14135, partial [Devosia sp.]|nr:hypothetical protein [Devosia sp.]